MKNNSIFLLLLLSLYFNPIFSQNNSWEWARSASGSSLDRARSITKDNVGNVYVTGDYSSSPFTINANVFSAVASQFDIFVAKYDSLGNLIWAKKFGTSGNDYCNSITCDETGNVYIAGQFGISITFGNTTLTGVADVFLTKLDSSGNVIWAKSAGGTNAEQIYCVTTDKLGNVIVGGYFKSGSITFGTTTFSTAGQQDVFVAKYDSSGNALWAKRAGGILNDVGNSVATDDSGNVYLSGEFASSSISFDSFGLSTTGPWDAFVTKFSPTGNVIWVNQIGGAGLEYAESVVVDSASNCYVSGTFSSSTLSVGTTLLDLTNGNSYVLKFNKNGNALWGKNGGGASSYLFRNSLCLNKIGEPFLVGFFTSTSINFGIDTLLNSTQSGGADIFVVHFDTLGNNLSAKAYGGKGNDESVGITCANSQHYYITGAFTSDTLNYGPYSLYNTGNYDFFIAKSGNPTANNIGSLKIDEAKFYPNPLIDEATIAVNLKTNASTKLELLVFNQLGIEVYKTSFANGMVQLKKENFNPGIYFYQVLKSGNKSAQGKFCVQ